MRIFKKVFPALFLILIVCLFTYCGSDKTDKTLAKDNIEGLNIDVPDFNEDSAYMFLKTQVDLGTRVTGSPGWAKCRDYLVGSMRKWADTVIIQEAVVRTFNGLSLKANNIIASFNPEDSRRILLAAHWDTRPFADLDPNPENHKKPIDGANDGASGVAVLMEIARLMSENNPNIGIDIIFFDAEDYGVTNDRKDIPNSEYTWGLGSQYWAKNPHIPGYNARYGILLDMVGAPSPNFSQEGFSLKYAPDVLKRVWKTAARLGYGPFFTEKKMGYITDDHYFVNKYAGIPMIDIIHHDPSTPSGFFPYWHTMKDNIDNIDKNTLKIVGQTVITVIWEEK